MSVVQYGFQGSEPSSGCQTKPPPFPFQTSRNEALPYCITRVSVAFPFIPAKKSAPPFWAASASPSQLSQWPVQQHGLVSYSCRPLPDCSKYSAIIPFTYGAIFFHQAMSFAPSFEPPLNVFAST